MGEDERQCETITVQLGTAVPSELAPTRFTVGFPNGDPLRSGSGAQVKKVRSGRSVQEGQVSGRDRKARSGRCQVGKVSGREGVRSGRCQVGTVRSGSCPLASQTAYHVQHRPITRLGLALFYRISSRKRLFVVNLTLHLGINHESHSKRLKAQKALMGHHGQTAGGFRGQRRPRLV